MVEKTNKDGKPPTIEYQEEEILVRVISLNLFYDKSQGYGRDR